MSVVFLVDTNVLSEPMKRTPNALVVRRIQAHLDGIAVPAPAWHELVFGCQRMAPGRRRTALEAYLKRGIESVFPVFPYDHQAASWHGHERARLQGEGLAPPFVDGQIAAIAATNDLVLVTANVQDFEHFNGLSVVDWTAG